MPTKPKGGWKKLQESRKRKENFQNVMEKVPSLFSFYVMSDDETGQTSSKGDQSAEAPIVDEDEIYAAGSSKLPEQQSIAEHDDEQRQ